MTSKSPTYAKSDETVFEFKLASDEIEFSVSVPLTNEEEAQLKVIFEAVGERAIRKLRIPI